MDVLLAVETASEPRFDSGRVALLLLVLLALVALPLLLTRLAPRLGRRVRGLLLFASGAKRKALDETEETEYGNYLGLGSSVLITSTVAACSVLTATVVALHQPWYLMLPIALAYGLIIFALDRFLVSLQLNPYRYPSDIDLAPDGARYSAVRATARTLVAAVPRLLFAVLIGFLIAEPVLLVLFKPEIDTRVAALQADLAADAAERTAARFDDEIAVLSTPVEGADELQANREGLLRVQEEIDAKDLLVNQLDDLHTRECEGIVVENGAGQTSDAAGCGPRASAIETRRDEAQVQLDQAKAEQRRLEAASGPLERTTGVQEEERIRLLNEKKAERREQQAADAKAAGETSGLLIRIYALEELATDPKPYSPMSVEEREEGAGDSATEPEQPPSGASESVEPQKTPGNATAPADGTDPAVSSGPDAGVTPADDRSRAVVTAAAVTPAPQGSGAAGESGAPSAGTPGSGGSTSDQGPPAAGTSSQRAGDAATQGDAADEATGLFGLTILGKVVWIVRLWLVLLDAMPVLFKVILSTRRSRPYDAVVARHEENVIGRQTLLLAQERGEREAQLRRVMVERARLRNEVYVTEGRVPGGPPPDVSILVRLGGQSYTVPVERWLWVADSPDADVPVPDPTIDRYVKFERSSGGYAPRWVDGAAFRLARRAPDAAGVIPVPRHAPGEDQPDDSHEGYEGYGTGGAPVTPAPSQDAEPPSRRRRQSSSSPPAGVHEGPQTIDLTDGSGPGASVRGGRGHVRGPGGVPRERGDQVEDPDVY